MSQKVLLKDLVPKRLKTNYSKIRDLLIDSELDIQEFQQIINDSQPQTPEEELLRSMFQYIYRRDTSEFYKFLLKTKLYHMILWTEAKNISRHFKLNGRVYVHWNGEEYECMPHRGRNELEKSQVARN
jgi:hypothetical protein